MKFLLCMNKDVDVKEYSNLHSDSAIDQGLCDIGDEKWKIFGKVYYCLRVTMREAGMYQELMHDMMGRNEFEDNTRKSEGFMVELNGTTGGSRIRFK